MYSKIIIYNNQSHKYSSHIVEKSPDKIWEDIKTICNNMNQKFITDVFVNQIQQLWKTSDMYDNYKYEIKLNVSDKSIIMSVFTYIQSINTSDYLYSKRLKLNIQNNGNCIDDFIYRGIEPIIENIIDLNDSILLRQNERMNSLEYHNTSCYEKDFSQIKFIQQEAKKIVENCERHLEKISEFYTRIS